MTYRKTILATGEVYHITNRTIAKVPLFSSNYDQQRFLNTISFYRHKNIPLRFSHYMKLPSQEQEKLTSHIKKTNKLLVEIIAFCLMPNHIHFLLKQLGDKGISTFMSKLQNSYAKYFNLKYKRTGALFQSMFRAVRIETDEQLTHVSRYIHLNPSTSYVCKIKDLKKYAWSSFPHYLGLKTFKFVKPSLVLGLFKDLKDYEKFVLNQADYQRQLANIKHLTLED